MAKLTAKARKAIPSSEFAGPNRSYPVNDRAHAANAKARAAQFASPAVKAQVDAKANRVLYGSSSAPAGRSSDTRPSGSSHAPRVSSKHMR